VCPTSDVVGFRVHNLDEEDVRSAVLNRCRNSDLVVALQSVEEALGERPGQQFLTNPPFEFSGFHPDIVPVRLDDGSILQSPTGYYSSLIAISGFMAGFSVERIASCYNALFYRRLGYFDTFVPALAALKNDFKAHGFDMSRTIERWRQNGPFMYSVNHPKPFVLADVAYEIAKRTGMNILEYGEYSDFYPDSLCLYAVYPVFPEIARYLKVDGGSYLFKPISGAQVPRVMGLNDYVRKSIVIFSRSADRIVPGERIKQATAMFKNIV
jgi:hypothetical protein